MPTEVTSRCVIYVRVSSEEQVKNLSLETQQDICRRYAVGQGWSVERVFVEEGESAKTSKRTEFQKLLEYCRAQKARVGYVVVYSVNRYMRNTEEHFAVRGILKRMGILLRSATEPIEETAVGRWIETVLAGGAQYDNDQRSERTIVGMKAAITRGRWVWPAPIGYRNVRTAEGKKTLELDAQRAPLVRLAFELAAAGAPMADIVSRLKSHGMTGPRGAPFDRKTLANLLRRSAYAGIMRVKDWKLEASGDWPPIIDLETYRAAQARLRGRKHPIEVHLRQNPDFPLRHFVRHAGCQKPLTGYWATGRGRKYAYYECQPCRVRIGRDALEDTFVALLDELRPRPAVMRLFKAEVLEYWNERRRKAAGEAEALQRRVDALRAKKLRYADAFVIDRSLDRETYESLVAKVDEERDQAELDLAAARVEKLDAEALVDYGLHVITHAGSLWRDATLGQRTALQGFLFAAGLAWGKENGFTRTTVRGFEFSNLSAVSGLCVEDGDPSRHEFEPFLRAAKALKEILPLAA